MIVTGMVLLAIGAADVARQFLHGRVLRIVLGAGAVAVLVLAVLTAAPLAGLLAVALAVVWVWLFPARIPARAGFWPAVALAVLCIVFVAVLGPREEAGILGGVWDVPTPWGPLSVDHTLLLVGAVCILLESGNVIVRAALASEMPASIRTLDASEASGPGAPSLDPEAASPDGEPVEERVAPAAPPATPTPTLKGGRLIGPLERIIVFALTLTGVYSLLAAVLAAKGIVRFPEISRDGETGSRAEYFLIGSLVSWVVALAAAFLVWWALSGVI
ncbi:hypothetical protein [uncultured Microbacterium sp.]|uniref:hypothetical protein n=1 Tax=uncultured Microbacterium sp. TaxID=191216 RepID=UPI0028D735B3|nr:hypothetical protein [uncultured Microbacterium sp.]